MAVELGKVYTDSITGFSGVAVSRTEYLHGCVRIQLQPKALHEGKPIESQVFDEQQLDATSTVRAGGPGDPLPRRVVPQR